MATTKINIINRALGLLGAEFITTLTEDTKAARFSNELFDDTRDSLFRMHPWNCCIKRAALSLTGTTPAFYFTAEFQLPADWLRMVRPEDDGLEYKIEGDKSTPKGIFSIGAVYYRKDRVDKPYTNLKTKIIKKNMAWCNEPKNKFYN